MKFCFLTLVLASSLYAAECSIRQETPGLCALSDYLRSEGHRSEDFDVEKAPAGFQGQSASTGRDGSYCTHALQKERNEYHFCGDGAVGSDWTVVKNWSSMRDGLEFWRQIPGKYKEMIGNLAPASFTMSKASYDCFQERLVFASDGVTRATTTYVSELVSPAVNAVVKHTVLKVQARLKNQLEGLKDRVPVSKVSEASETLVSDQASSFLQNKANALSLQSDAKALWRELEPIWHLFHERRETLPPADADLIKRLYTSYFDSQGILSGKVFAESGAGRSRVVSLKLQSDLSSPEARLLRRLANKTLAEPQDEKTHGTLALLFAADRALVRGGPSVGLKLAGLAARNASGEVVPELTLKELSSPEEPQLAPFVIQGLVVAFNLPSKTKTIRIGKLTMDPSLLMGTLIVRALSLQKDLEAASADDDDKLAVLVRRVGDHPNVRKGNIFTTEDWEKIKSL